MNLLTLRKASSKLSKISAISDTYEYTIGLAVTTAKTN